ncbi:hypothetical protein ACJZ2D_009380 [Fusarium nematophilum]
MSPNPIKEFDTLVSEFAFVFTVYYRGHWCPFCISWLKALAALEPSITAAGGKTVIVTAELDKHLPEVRTATGYTGAAISDPENLLAKELKKRDVVDVAISKRWGYNFGMAQPAVAVIKNNGIVLESWAINPTVMNAGGAKDRPDLNQIWENVQAALEGRKPVHEDYSTIGALHGRLICLAVADRPPPLHPAENALPPSHRDFFNSTTNSSSCSSQSGDDPTRSILNLRYPMADSGPSFQYSPLAGPQNIRVLVLHPALKAAQQIQCFFREISLQDDPATVTYEALSYTWGAPQGTQPIQCEGGTILVTPNCEQALLHLRQKFKPRNLWIDAVCINQQATEEKNEQVTMMGDIYRSAARTILWLGPKTDSELSGVLRRAKRYGNAYQGLRRAFRRIRPDDSLPYNERYFEAPILSAAETSRVVRICSNEWFRRMWTIQEFVLSKSSVFMMGNLQCPSLSLFSYFCFGRGIVTRADLAHYRMRNTLVDFSPPSEDGQYLQDFMVVVIQLAVLNNATDPRDKVYGMIAFLKSRLPELDFPAVDYSLSVEAVYEHFTRFLIMTSKRLWPLELIVGSSRDESQTSSSWVLDLRNADSIFANFTDGTNYHQSSEHKLPLTMQHTGQLRIRAKAIGRVTRVSVRMPWDDGIEGKSVKELDEQRSECLAEWTAFVTDLDLNEDQSRSPYLFHPERDPNRSRRPFDSPRYSRPKSVEGPCSDPNARALTAITHCLNYLRVRQQAVDEISVDSHYSPFETESVKEKKMKKKRKDAKKRAEKGPDIFDPDARRFDRCVLFLTSRGHLAQSPGDVCGGDHVCVVEGSNYPFVLRRRSNGKGFRLVGKASVYQFKEKKGWDPAKWEDDEPGVHEIVLF